ncbi:RES family NAD+ phosphorylase [Verrucomicrobium spinosum]|uniref:RES family NAD+ phosphorylase n=1 Tax=Verrucomicrobium spinosum TaxID=2736 RepID=UPI0012E0E00B|nr:RES family NAD+ phosphorylase [Verrucomicrobium spinosum]
MGLGDCGRSCESGAGSHGRIDAPNPWHQRAGDDRGLGEDEKSPTQELALAAYASGRIAAIKYGSAKHPGGVNLVVFPDRLVAPSTDYLEVYDPHGSLPQRIGG